MSKLGLSPRTVWRMVAFDVVAPLAAIAGLVGVGLVLDWINGDMKEDAQKIIGKLSLLMYGNVSRALEAYRADFRQNS